MQNQIELLFKNVHALFIIVVSPASAKSGVGRRFEPDITMNSDGLEIRIADLEDSLIVDLLSTHARLALAGARCRQGHALEIDALRDPAIEVWSIWYTDRPVAVGAIRRLSTSHSELKSMFVAETARGMGIGRILLEHLIAVARSNGMKRLSLETGASEYFAAARALYSNHQFEVCNAFADLPPHPDSVFMTREL